MKKHVLIAIVAFGVYFPSHSQALINFQGRQYEQKNSRWYDEYGNIVNNKIITIKLKDRSSQTASLEMGKKVRENSLGYIDIELSDTSFFAQLHAISEDPNIESIDINTFGVYNVSQVTPNDPQWTNQWYIDRIQAQNAWNYTMGGECIVVGVLDSGVDWEHEDLGVGHDTYQNIWLNPGEDIWSNQNNPNTGNGIDDDSDGLIDNWKGWDYDLNSNDVRTVNAHGTQVAGIISAKANNGRGIAGIAGGNNHEGVKILGLCIGISVPDGSVLDDAILHAVDKGVRVIQISASVGETSAINAAIQHAVDNGVVVVCAAGNGFGAPVGYPASNSNVISVGATNQSDQRAALSNFGNNLVLAAPGEDIRTTTLNNGYDDVSGTSFAAPMVSATIALMLSINPELTPAQIRNIITSTADKVGGYTYIGGRCDELGFGRLNTYSALTAVSPTITGSDRICTTSTNFTLQDLPTGQTATWAVLPTHLFPSDARSGTGTTAPIRAANVSTSGAATLTFTVTTACGTYQVSKQIWVGVPSASTSIVPNYQPICTGEYTYFNAFYDMLGTNPPGNKEADITNYIWTPPSGVSCFTAGTKNEVLACWFTSPGIPQTVSVRAVNSCGQGALSYANFTPSSCFFFSVGINPNPASGRVSIELTETPLDEEAKAVLASENKGTREYQEYSFDDPPHRVRVFDVRGAERLCVEDLPEGSRYELDISHLTPGVYVVHLEHKNGTVVRQLRVE